VKDFRFGVHVLRRRAISLSGIGPTGCSPEVVDKRVALIRAASPGRDVELQALVQRMIITEDPRRTAEGLRDSLAGSVEDMLATPYLWIGTGESICEHVLAVRARWGFSYFTVFHDALEAAAPIVTRLADA